MVENGLEGQILRRRLKGGAAGKEREENASQCPDVTGFGGVLVLQHLLKKLLTVD